MSEAESKADLRRQFRTAVAVMSASERAAASDALCSLLCSQSVWEKAHSILFFSPLRDEPDIWRLLKGSLAAGRKVILPRYLPAEDRYTLHVIDAGPRALEPGRFGILEPTLACPKFDAKRLDLALVPGLGFSLAGHRLGRGKGYFDRLLAEVPGFKCGVAFDCQVVPELPAEPHDVRLNGILTPTRWLPVES